MLRYWLRLSFILGICLLWALPGQAQWSNSINYNTQNGLPSSETYAVAQDDQGTIWIGSDHGLTSFDGADLRTYGFDDGLPDIIVFKFYKDCLGRIWASTQSNAIILIQNGKVENYAYSDLVKKHAGSVSRDLLLHYDCKQEKLFVSGPFVSFSVDDNGQVVQDTALIDIAKGRQQSDVKKYYYDYKVDVFEEAVQFDRVPYLGTDSAEILIRTPSEEWILPAARQGQNFYPIHGPKDIIYLITGKSLLVVNLKQKKIKYVDFQVSLYYLWWDQLTNQLFIGTYLNGMLICSADGEQKDQLFSGVSVTSMMRDREANIWLTTLEKGVFMLPQPTLKPVVRRNQNRIVNFQKQPHFISIIYEDGKVFQHYRIDSMVQKKMDIPDHLEAYAVGYQEKGTEPYLQIVSKELNGNQDNYMRLFLETERFGTYGGLSNNFYWFDPGKGDYIGKSMPEAPRAFLEVDTAIFIGTTGGLYHISPHIDPFQWSENLAEDYIIVECLVQFREHLLIGTRGKGLACYNFENKKFMFFEGIGANSLVHQIVAEKDQFWVAAGNQVYVATIEDHALKIVSTINPNVGVIRHLAVTDTAVYLGNRQGVYALDRQDQALFLNTGPPILNLHRLSNYDIDYDLKSTAIELPYAENNLYVAYNAVHYSSFGAITYRYRLQGLSEHWQTGTGREIMVRNIPSGRYKLEIQAANWKGEWSLVKAIDIFIPTPFWKTWWFIVALILIGLFIIRLIFKAKQRKIELENQSSEFLLQALQAQMNPHFIFNALNSIRSLIFTNDLEKADQYLIQFAGLTRKVLTSTKQKWIDVREEVEIIRKYLDLEQMRNEDAFDFTIKLDPALEDDLPVPAMITQPFVENAVLHGVLPLRERRGKITIQFSVERSNRLTIKIEDNGDGVKESKRKKGISEHQSLGIDLVRKRLQTLSNGCSIQIKDRSEEGGLGTLVILTLEVE